MKGLRAIRITLALLFLAATTAYLLTGGMIHGVALSITQMAERIQIIPSAFAITMGATAFWLAVTFLIGRVYCSTVCPVGTLQDLAFRLRRSLPERILRRLRLPEAMRWRSPRRWRYDVLIGYIICLIFGFTVVPLLIEPWQIVRDAAAVADPQSIASTWGTLAYGVTTGIIAGITSLILIIIWGFITGRDFCNTLCPLGTAMGFVSQFALYQMQIDPDKCISCMKCEDGCRGGCIKVVSRYVDNSRCVRCFDCMNVCPNQAIGLHIGAQQRPATPLLQRRKKIKI